MTIAGHDNSKGPSVAELQRFIRDKVTLELLLNNGEKIYGKLRWFDHDAFSLMQDGQHPITVQRMAVVAYRIASRN